MHILGSSLGTICSPVFVSFPESVYIDHYAMKI